MVTSVEIVERILGLDDRSFFGMERAEVSRRELKLLDEDFWGVAINAPRRIDMLKRDSLPLWVAVRMSGERDHAIPLKTNCVLVATNLEDGAVYGVLAFVSEKELATRGGPRWRPRSGSPENVALRSAQLTCLDVRGRLGIKWQSGSWSLGLIYFDWLSNIVPVELDGAVNAEHPRSRLRRAAPRVSAGAALPSFRPIAGIPPFPLEGLSYSLEPSTAEGRRTLKVFGSFVIQVRPLHLEFESSADDQEQARVRALVPVTLLITAIDFGEPLQLDWAVPVYGESLAVGSNARGCFAVDALDGLDSDELPGGGYVAFAVLDSRIYGPEPFVLPAGP